LFFKATIEQAQRVQTIVDSYAAATGQLINKDKCSILFGEGCPQGIQEEVKCVLQVQANAFEEKYLGLPTPDGRMHKGRFQNLQGKLLKRILI
jgi:hypothetical protein